MPPKRKHTDVRADGGRAKAGKADRVYTICMKLPSAWKPSAIDDFAPTLFAILPVAARLCQEVCVFVNGLVLFAIHNRQRPPQIDQGLIDQCFGAIINKRPRRPTILRRKPKPEEDTPENKTLEQLQEEKNKQDAKAVHQQLENERQRLIYHFCQTPGVWDRSDQDYSIVPAALYQEMRKSILTAARNSLSMPFFGRQESVLKWQLFEPTPEKELRVKSWLQGRGLADDAKGRNKLRSHLQNVINGCAQLWPDDVVFRDIVDAHRRHRLFRELPVVYEDKLDKHDSAVLEYYAFLLDELVKAHAMERNPALDYPKCKLFSVLPLRGFKQAHMPLTQTVMQAIFKKPDLELADVIREKWMKKGCSYLTTDGVTCHLAFTKTVHRAHAGHGPNLAQASRGLFVDADLDQDSHVPRPCIVGVDPGRDRIIQASTGYSISKAQYYEECGFNTANRRRKFYMRQLSADDHAVMAQMSAISLKVADWLTFQQRWKAQTPLWATLFRVHGDPRFGNHRLYKHRRKQQCLARMTKALAKEGSGDPIIAFGNGKFATSYRGARAGPGRSIAKRLSHTLRVVMVDEYLTSQRCSECHQQLEKPHVTTFDRRSKSLVFRKAFSVLQCPHCQVYWNRDVNAARNMRMLLQEQLSGRPRPDAFRRPPPQPA